MNYHVLTLFPEMIEQAAHTSILGRALKNGCISLETWNIRDYSTNKHMRVDDYPYGGGAGMVIEAEPVYRAYSAVKDKIGRKPRTIYLTPQAKVLNQTMVEELALEKDLVMICGDCDGLCFNWRLCADWRRTWCYGSYRCSFQICSGSVV